MGINAQTSVPKFTSGDVLTAANTNLLTNAPPVFSGTATRDAAFGGAGEKTLAEGQLCYLEDSDIVQYYDGAAWASVGSLTAATQAEQEAGTSLTTTVTPARQQFHPSAAKFWIQFVGSTAAISSSYNVSSVTDGGIGTFTVNINVDMSSANYAIVTGIGFQTGITEAPTVTINTDVGVTAGAVPLACQNPTGSARVDVAFVYVAGFGDQ